jgi:UDP-N-acetyl-2-amino-2-deoxyglucuronate dehydrogenase
VLELKRLLEEKRLGSINNVALVLRWFRPQVYFEKDDWRGDKKKDGGLLFSQGSHYLDILRWFFGPADSVFGKAATVGHKITMDDMVTAVIKFQNGAYATIELTLCTYPSNIECSLSILGERGSIKVAGSALDKIEFWKVDGLEQPDLASGIAPNVYAGGLYQGSCPNHIFIYKNVIKCLLGKKPDKPYIDGREARKFVELAEAIYKSSRTGKEIFLS